MFVNDPLHFQSMNMAARPSGGGVLPGGLKSLLPVPLFMETGNRTDRTLLVGSRLCFSK